MLAKAMDRVLVVGSGLTGAVTASLLRERLSDTCQIQVWDKARGAGGRMSTSRSAINPECTVDLGAQYFSPFPEEYNSHKRFYEQLTSEGLLTPLAGVIEGSREYPEGTKHFVAPNGSGSVVKHFLQKSGAQTKFGYHLGKLDQESHSWQATTQDGTTDNFNVVVLTMPVPQVLALNGNIQRLLETKSDLADKLKAVSYSSRFALGLFYEPGVHLDLPWCAKYFMQDPCIRFVAIDNKKRGLACLLFQCATCQVNNKPVNSRIGQYPHEMNVMGQVADQKLEPEARLLVRYTARNVHVARDEASSFFIIGIRYKSVKDHSCLHEAEFFCSLFRKEGPTCPCTVHQNVGPSVVVHCSVPFSLQHLETDKDSVCSNMVLPPVRKLLPQVPEPSAVKNHKWRFSQVHQGYLGSPGALELCSSPLLIIGGDAFVATPKFDGCLESALKIAESIDKYAAKLASSL